MGEFYCMTQQDRLQRIRQVVELRLACGVHQLPDFAYALLAAPSSNACFTRSGNSGCWRRRTPVNWNTALAIAVGTSGVAIWPAPVG